MTDNFNADLLTHENPATILSDLIKAIDDYNEKYNITPMAEDIVQSQEGRNWQNAYYHAKEFLKSLQPSITIAHK